MDCIIRPSTVFEALSFDDLKKIGASIKGVELTENGFPKKFNYKGLRVRYDADKECFCAPTLYSQMYIEQGDICVINKDSAGNVFEVTSKSGFHSKYCQVKL